MHFVRLERSDEGRVFAVKEDCYFCDEGFCGEGAAGLGGGGWEVEVEGVGDVGVVECVCVVGGFVGEEGP